MEYKGLAGTSFHEEVGDIAHILYWCPNCKNVELT